MMLMYKSYGDNILTNANESVFKYLWVFAFKMSGTIILWLLSDIKG